MKKYLLLIVIPLLLASCSDIMGGLQDYKIHNELDVAGILNLYSKSYEQVSLYFADDEKGDEEHTLGETIVYYIRHTRYDGDFDIKVRLNNSDRVVDIKCMGIDKSKGYDWNIELTYAISYTISDYYSNKSVDYWANYSFDSTTGNDDDHQTRSKSTIWNYVRTYPLKSNGYMAEYYDTSTHRTMVVFDAKDGVPYFTRFYRTK